MRDPTVNGGAQVESVVPFAPTQRTSDQDGGADQLDKAGQSILHLLHRAAGVAEENSRHALDMAQKLSHQLRAAEDRIAELVAEVAAYQDRLHAPSNGCTRSILRSKTVSRGKRNAATERGNARLWGGLNWAVGLPAAHVSGDRGRSRAKLAGVFICLARRKSV